MRFKKELAGLGRAGFSDADVSRAKNLATELNRLSVRRINKEFDDARRAARGFFSELQEGIGSGLKLDSIVQGIGQGVGIGAFNLGISAITAPIQAVKDFGFASFDAASKLQTYQTTLLAVTGEQAKANQELAFARAEIERLSLPIDSSIKGFVQLSAAAKETKLEGQSVRELFVGMGQAATNLSLDAQRVDRSFLALSQIISKGKVSNEELRQQLGESLPGAMQIAARAMGTTTQELDKLLRKGAITAEEFIPRFAAQLQKEFGSGADTATRALNRFGTAVFNVQSAAGQAFLPAVTTGINLVADAINGVTKDEALFKRFADESKKFADELGNNKALAIALNDSLSEAATALTDEAIGAAKGLTEALRENPRLLADMVRGAASFTGLLGRATLEIARVTVGAVTLIQRINELKGASDRVVDGFIDKIPVFQDQIRQALEQTGNTVGPFGAFLNIKNGIEEAATTLDSFNAKLRDTKVGLSSITDFASELNFGATAGGGLKAPNGGDTFKPFVPTKSDKEIEKERKRQQREQEKAAKAAKKALEEANKRTIKDFETGNIRAQSEIDKIQQVKVSGILAAQLEGTKGEKQAALEIAKVQADTTSKVIRQKEGELKELRSLRSRFNDPNEFAQKELAAQKEIDNLRTQSLRERLENEKSLKLRSIDLEVSAQKLVTDRIVQELDREKNALDTLINQQDLLKQVTESRSSVRSASADFALNQSQTVLNEYNRIDEFRKRLKNDKELNFGTQRALQAFTTDANIVPGQSDLDILKQRQVLEDDIANKKLTALQAEQQSAKALLEIDLKRQEISARQGLLEARNTAAKAEQAKIDAEANLKRAGLTGNSEEIAAAQQQLANANDAKGFASGSINLANQNLSILPELARNAWAAQGLKAQSDLNQFITGERARRQDQAVGLAEAGGSIADVDAAIAKARQAILPQQVAPQQMAAMGLGAPVNEINQATALMQSEFKDQFNELVRNTMFIPVIADMLREANMKPASELLNRIPGGMTAQQLLATTPSLPTSNLATLAQPKPEVAQQMSNALKQANADVEKKLAAIAGNIIQFANGKGDTYQLYTPDPIADVARIQAEKSKQSVRRMGL